MITSPHNEKLKLVRRLLARRRERDREGLFVAEGEDLVMAGIEAGQQPTFLLKQAEVAIDLPGAPEPIEVEPKLLAAVSSLGSGCRLLGVWPHAQAEPQPAAYSVYLDAIADPSNVGAIIRSSHALTGGTVALGPGCADPFGPKSVRASMGSIFACPPVGLDFDQVPGPRLGLVARGGGWPLEAVLATADLRPQPNDRPGRQPPDRLQSLTLCLGSERSGLSPEVAAGCDALLTIPLPGGAESLNVAAAAAICLERVSSLAVLATGSELNPPNVGTDA